MIMSILFPDHGRISVLGQRSALEAKDRIGYLPEERGVYRKMKAVSFLTYIARLKGRDGPDVRRRVKQWLERVGLGEAEKKRCEELSKGMQQKLQFIAAVIHEPDLLILDEPFSGLDPVNMRLLRDLVLEQKNRGATIIFSTHVMQQAERLCDHIVMINNGLKVLDEDLSGIRKRFDPRTILFEPLEAEADVEPLRRLDGVRNVRAVDGAYEIEISDVSDPSRAMRSLIECVPAARVELNRPTLEDIFIRIVTEEGPAAAEDADRLRQSLGADR
jgi:ABC-2 type transport system ATP-binding protein